MIPKIAAGIALLVGAFFFGKQRQAQSSNIQIAQLANESQGLKQTAMLSLMGSKSASKRIQGVSYIEEFDVPDDAIVNALADRMLHDENTNVRRTAVEVLSEFTASETVKSSFIKALKTEKDPGIQISIIQVLGKIQEKKAVAPMKYLLDQEDTQPYVKDELKISTPTVFDITKQRLILASKQIRVTYSDTDKQDLGFKLFTTIPIWDDYGFDSNELTAQTKLFDESKLLDEDIKAILVTWKTNDGSQLIETFTEYDLDGFTGYYVAGKLYLMNKGFTTKNLKALLEKIDSDKNFNPTSIIAFGYHFESKSLREISENIKSYANKKSIDIDFITRY